MIEQYPRIRQYDDHGQLDLREGLILCFFMRRPHNEISQAVMRALDIYLDAVGPEKLGWSLEPESDDDPDEEGVETVMRPLDSGQWARVREKLRDPISCLLQLEEHKSQVGGFHVEYYGRQRTTLERPARSQTVSALSFWLPTEYLEEKGPSRVRDMAVAMARELPINSGYVSLAFNYLFRFRDVVHAVHEHCFRYPGLDVHDLSDASMELGTRVRGAYWLNFYGQPLLGQLGGAEGLRQRLDSPQVSVEELGEGKVLVALGTEPTTGEVEQKGELHPYRALARVLEPFLHQEKPDWFSFSLEQLRHWERRFTT
ncbi:hypothetical protein D187_000325 [Cystobacter fuscus DSM 2262]|uniref:DUF3396 domain-containing protein n=1 Tax=Cystobacter fuscus (strain ATCC 25194 / DSM 2262 / NBRC 100088 / M29) TaxID=1242864 RepID=S9PQV5_CYSF2|nr:type VI immunity family protein [Cystobacter fuscus]EPX64902.1 hypothetical protein D187_000325 [Cystobacter fuscus DSM 2262]